VAQDDRALRYASAELWGDREFVQLWGDREFILRIVERNGWTLQYVRGDLRFDHEVISRAVMEDNLEFPVQCRF